MRSSLKKAQLMLFGFGLQITLINSEALIHCLAITLVTNYVDWVGFSGFNWGQSARPDGKWMSFRDLSAGAYDKLATLNKPIMVSETSSSSIGGSKQAWFDQTLEKDIPSKPQIKAVVFYDADFNSSNFSLTSDMDYQSVISDDIVKNGYYLPNPEIK
jgi:hypothetical protein